MGRRARAHIIRGDGVVLGCVPVVELDAPWWQEAGDLVAALRERYGLDTVVLRLVSASTTEFQPDADVAYAVELLGDLPPGLPLERCEELDLGSDRDPLRMPWARVGGVAADVDWADRELRALGRRRTAPAIQVRTWNLSLLLRLPTDQGVVWLKHVPPFLRHEGEIIELVRAAGAAVPTILAADRGQGRLLLDDVAGQDMYSVDSELAIRMVESHIRLQERMTGRREAIAATGAPDWGAESLMRQVTDLLVPEGMAAGFDRLIGRLPAMLEALYSCGLEDTLVHGDFFPGNYRFDGRSLVLLDWGDSGWGHPLLDMTAFLERIQAEDANRVRETWIKVWEDAHPAADVSRAADLIRPIGAVRQAVVYRRFLNGIEASERVYHRADVPRWLGRAIALSLAGEG